MAQQEILMEDGFWVYIHSQMSVRKYSTPRAKSSKSGPLTRRTIGKDRIMKKRPVGRRFGFEGMWLEQNIPAEYRMQKGRNVMDFLLWYSSPFFQCVCCLGWHRCPSAFLQGQPLAHRKNQNGRMGLWRGVITESTGCRCKIINKQKCLTYHFLPVTAATTIFYE